MNGLGKIAAADCARITSGYLRSSSRDEKEVKLSRDVPTRTGDLNVGHVKFMLRLISAR
jgi:hypothetical protein